MIVAPQRISFQRAIYGIPMCIKVLFELLGMHTMLLFIDSASQGQARRDIITIVFFLVG